MGYAQSELIAEGIIETASQQSGLKSMIRRVGQVSGPTIEHVSWSLREWFPGLIAASIGEDELLGSLSSIEVVDRILVELAAQILVELLLGRKQQQ